MLGILKYYKVLLILKRNVVLVESRCPDSIPYLIYDLACVCI